MALTRLPLLIDAHFHARDLGQKHKGTFESETKAALLGGVGTVLTMPNTDPPLITPWQLDEARDSARDNIYCDVGFHFGTDCGFTEMTREYLRDSLINVHGLKVYLDPTTGDLQIKDLNQLDPVFFNWTADKPILIHAEDLEKLRLVISLAEKYRKRIHICHVSRAEQVEIIRKARRDLGIMCVTSEVCPHHLAFTSDDVSWLGPYGIMKPPLGTMRDKEALWQGLQDCTIDIIATDHAPHSKEEKTGSKPPFGVISEPVFPVLWKLFHDRGLKVDWITSRMFDLPADIFGVKKDSESYMEVDLGEEYGFTREMINSKAGRSPYEGMKVLGRIHRIFLHGQLVAQDGEIVAKNGKLI